MRIKNPLTKAKMIEAVKKRSKLGILLAERELRYMKMLVGRNRNEQKDDK